MRYLLCIVLLCLACSPQGVVTTPIIAVSTSFMDNRPQYKALKRLQMRALLKRLSSPEIEVFIPDDGRLPVAGPHSEPHDPLIDDMQFE